VSDLDDQELIYLERKHRNCMNACPHRWQAFGKEPHCPRGQCEAPNRSAIPCPLGCAHCHRPWEDGGCTVRRLVAALREARGVVGKGSG
jgi:hypothetical protein